MYTHCCVVGNGDSVLIREVSFLQSILYREFHCITIHSYQQVCNNNKLAGCICHNLKQQQASYSCGAGQVQQQSRSKVMLCVSFAPVRSLYAAALIIKCARYCNITSMHKSIPLKRLCILHYNPSCADLHLSLLMLSMWNPTVSV